MMPDRDMLLRFFLVDGARQMTDLLAAHPAADPAAVKRLVYALTLAGLLEAWGRSRGRFYYTTRLGFVVLAEQDKSSRRQSPPP